MINVNLYSHTEKVFKTVIENQYELHKRGLYDFPSKKAWLEKQWKIFKQNNPELCGLVYDPKNKDWVHEYKGGLIRTIL